MNRNSCWLNFSKNLFAFGQCICAVCNDNSNDIRMVFLLCLFEQLISVCLLSSLLCTQYRYQWKRKHDKILTAPRELMACKMRISPFFVLISKSLGLCACFALIFLFTFGIVRKNRKRNNNGTGCTESSKPSTNTLYYNVITYLTHRKAHAYHFILVRCWI